MSSSNPHCIPQKPLLQWSAEEVALWMDFVHLPTAEDDQALLKENDLKLNNETELVQFLSYYEQLTHPSSTVAANEGN